VRGARLLVVAAALAAVLGAAAWWRGRPAPSGDVEAPLALMDALRPETAEGFGPAMVLGAFLFPVDHGPHPEYRTEWWYYIGHLDADGGKRGFGFQLTFFRLGLAPSPAPRLSRWGAHEVYLAHFALTDVAARRFHVEERWSRGALGLAGATGAPFRVWLEAAGACRPVDTLNAG
jgi:predicted secreted hydrolase